MDINHGFCKCGHHTKDHSYSLAPQCADLECDKCSCQNFEPKEEKTKEENTLISQFAKGLEDLKFGRIREVAREEKTKDVGTIHKSEKVIAKAVSFLNGEENHRFSFVPIILLDYKTPDNAHAFAKGERFKFWIKLEDATHSEIQKQLKKGLREISIWFDEENEAKLKEFLQ